MKYLVVITCLCLCSCSLKSINKSTEQKLSNVDSLIVVHPTLYFDQDEEAKVAINYITDVFLKYNKKVFTLVENKELINKIMISSTDERAQDYLNYLKNIKQTTLVESENGENSLILNGSNIVVVGGYLRACLRAALKSIANNNFKSMDEINIFLPLIAIYGKEIMNKSDSRELEKRVRSLVTSDITIEIYRKSKMVMKLEGEQADKKIRLIFTRPINKESSYPSLNFYN